MPYISSEKRIAFAHWVYRLDLEGVSVGELNYLITCLLLKTRPVEYTDYNKLIGVLECVKQEFYRRAVVPYEEQKRKENGDVYS